MAEPRAWSASRSWRELAQHIHAAGRLTVLTGAGVSAASGVPTFRGPHGLWSSTAAQTTPSTVEGWRRYRATDLATPDAFTRDPALVWEWYAWRRATIAACRPNRAHEVIAAWTMRNPQCRVVTQNVDDLHVRAGTQCLVRLHGSLWELSCWQRCAASPRTWRDERVPLPAPVPTCPHCGALARPAVVWFGERLDPGAVEAAADAAACDVFLTIGTSASVYPAASFLHAARRHGAFTAEINLETTPASSMVDVAIQGPAEEVLDAIEAAR
jgi:NAD-dependent deacetylase